MTTPTVVIELRLEARPHVHIVALHDGDQKRVIDWLTEARPEYAELVARALELERREHAA